MHGVQEPRRGRGSGESFSCAPPSASAPFIPGLKPWVSWRLLYEHDLIAHENLQVSNMVQSNLARSISDVGWSAFLNILSLKAESAARRVVPVNSAYTSQQCHSCGHTSKANRLNQSRFVCQQCGHEDNADWNAARNILARAGTRPSGVNVSGVSHGVA